MRIGYFSLTNQGRELAGRLNEKLPGKIFEKDGTYFRPVQYNLNSYGEKMRLLKIDLDKNDWIGTVVDEYTVDSFGLDNMSKTHTYSQIQDVCTIDALHEYRTFLAPYYISRRKFHNFYFRVKNFRRKIKLRIHSNFVIIVTRDAQW